MGPIVQLKKKRLVCRANDGNNGKNFGKKKSTSQLNADYLSNY